MATIRIRWNNEATDAIVATATTTLSYVACSVNAAQVSNCWTSFRCAEIFLVQSLAKQSPAHSCFVHLFFFRKSFATSS